MSQFFTAPREYPIEGRWPTLNYRVNLATTLSAYPLFITRDQTIIDSIRVFYPVANGAALLAKFVAVTPPAPTDTEHTPATSIALFAPVSTAASINGLTAAQRARFIEITSGSDGIPPKNSLLNLNTTVNTVYGKNLDQVVDASGRVIPANSMIYLLTVSAADVLTNPTAAIGLHVSLNVRPLPV